ncbi:unnamed protein product [marine sediment metagenome]|uniref:Uncharacterized protein n=1 Tax=marine sediment metagenome TaxID=412755 RepID=X1FKC2_9ZZZZ
MEIKGWEEVDQDIWNTLPLQLRATVTFSDPYKVLYIAESAGLNKLDEIDDERTEPTDAEEGVEGDSGRAEDSEAQH